MRFPIWIQGNAPRRALKFVFGSRRRRRLTARVIVLGDLTEFSSLRIAPQMSANFQGRLTGEEFRMTNEWARHETSASRSSSRLLKDVQRRVYPAIYALRALEF